MRDPAKQKWGCLWVVHRSPQGGPSQPLGWLFEAPEGGDLHPLGIGVEAFRPRLTCPEASAGRLPGRESPPSRPRRGGPTASIRHPNTWRRLGLRASLDHPSPFGSLPLSFGKSASKAPRASALPSAGDVAPLHSAFPAPRSALRSRPNRRSAGGVACRACHPAGMLLPSAPASRRPEPFPHRIPNPR